MKKVRILALLLSFVVIIAALDRESRIKYPDPDKIYYPDEVKVVVSDDGVVVNGRTIRSSKSIVYPSHDVEYYEDRDYYDSGRPYGEGTDADKHTAEEAAEVTVINITQPGTYRLSGKMENGQVRVDLGKKTSEKETAVVTLVLDGLDINCEIAPAIVFKNVYEPCSDVRETAIMEVDTSKSGANIIISDGSVNNLSGANVAKIFRDEDETRKLCKQDGTITSHASLNINGEPEESGVLNINAGFEGISSDLHMTINGGNINIVAQDDGINTKVDFTSVTTINGGNLRILAGLREDGGDGIDSNGWIVSNGGTTVTIGHHRTDSGIDNDSGYFANGGVLVSYGSYVDWADMGSTQASFNLEFDNDLSEKDSVIITDTDGNVVFCYSPSKDEHMMPFTFDRFGIVITSPDFEIGKDYNVYVGYGADGTEYIEGEHKGGFYDGSTVTAFKGVQQKYYSNDDIKHGGFRPQEGVSYDIPYTEFSMNKIVNSFALIRDIDK